jgi:glycosyltransferase involved in cell wall biosynthesis
VGFEIKFDGVSMEPARSMGYKILIVGQWFVSEDDGKIVIPGGTERYVHGLAKQLQDDGYEVMVLSATTNKDEIGEWILDGIDVCKFKMPNRFYGHFADILAFVNTLKLIKKFNPDIVHVISVKYRFGAGAVAAAKVMGKKTVYTITLIPLKEGRNRLPLLLDHFIFSKMIKWSDVIISLSKEMKEFVLQDIRHAKMVIIPSFFTGNYRREREKRRNSLLFVGRLVIAHKGTDFLIKALRRVKKEIPTVKLHIVGEGDSLQYLEEIVSEYGLEKNVIFHGHIDESELIDMYSSSEILVMPSLMEGMPMVLLEAMSAGLPIIAFDIEPCVEALDGGKYGILVKTGDVKSLAQRIIELLKNGGQRAHYSRMSMKRSEDYLQETVVRRIEEVYSGLAKRI